MVSEDVKAYVSSLADLTFNSKPLINMLTMLADENVAHAAEIVEVVENHLTKVKTDVKLPILYLIDCIVKNVGGPYTELFSHNIVATFCSVFRVVDEKTRAEMFKLRQTWNDVFSGKKLYAIDVQISLLDPAWPVTASLPPSSSIHLNPKFLKGTAPSQDKQPVIPVTPSANSDPVTLDMQQQLIQKQKELIELQQKKVELELLQTKVRLREQISGGNLQGSGADLPHNFLLKPEVAKQLLPQKNVDDSKNVLSTTKTPTTTSSKTNNTNDLSTTARNQRLQLPTVNTGLRIQPANSALVAAAVNRPIRDPRLLRQQPQPNQQISQNQAQNTSNINTNVQLENKNNLESSNKIVNSKTSFRDIQNDPRLKNLNDNAPIQKFTDSDKPKSRISPKSRSDRSHVRSSRANNHTDDSKFSKSSSSSLDSPKKSKAEKSPTKSPSSRSNRKELKLSKEPKASKSDTALLSFKDVKNSKNRNYMRRNRSPQFSPEPYLQDVDLRLSEPPEKQPRILASPEKSNVTSNVIKEVSPPAAVQTMDVDLRQLPAVISKKRSSLDSPDQAFNKKSKTEIFDELFGNEDTDLRKLPDRPPTPPPPIISGSEIVVEKEIEPQPQKPDLEAVRAKLAANLKKSSSSTSSSSKAEDEDLRANQSSSQAELSSKIIISKDDDDKIKQGGMTSLQQKKLMNKIIAQIEAQKLKEAKKKIFEESFVNTSLTPISDDELDTDFVEESNKRKEAKESNSIPVFSFGDKDERILPPMHTVGPPEENFPKRFIRENRKGMPAWRGIRGRRHWDLGPHPRPPLRPWMQPPVQQPLLNKWGPPGNFRPQFAENMHPSDMDQHDRRSPDGNSDLIVESPGQEEIKTITIDGLPRDIRYYDEMAVIFMNWDDPRNISFQDGTRRVIFNDTDMYMMNLNAPYAEYRIGESLHKGRLGGPSREIYIDYKPYECYFGGPGITIDLNGKVTTVKLDGPPPQVKIGECRTDLVAGKIKLIIDAKTIIPIFLDAKVQTFTLNGDQHTVQFLPGLKSTLINNEHFDVQFGGLPKPVMLKENKHFIRFSVLPKGVKPGNVNIKGLESDDVRNSPRLEENLDVNEPALPIPQRVVQTYDPNMSPGNSNTGSLFQNIHNLSNLDFLTNAISSSDQAANSSAYQVETNLPQHQPESQNSTPSNMFNLNSINDLFQKLIASGMVTTSAAPTLKETSSSNQNQNREKSKISGKSFKKYPPMKPVSFDKPEQFKVRQGALYEKLYSGMQCSSCGMRFPPEQSMYYSQHLDWHFRQNRRGKKNTRVAASRKWYYSITDWQNYEEIENLEEREKNYFDQQQQAEGATETVVDEAELPSVTADPELQDICEVCGDKFEIFFSEDKEEWQFRNAIKDEDKIYHPICYEEYQQSLINASLERTDNDIIIHESNQIPGIEIVLDDDEEMENSEQIVDEVILDESDESKETVNDKVEDRVKTPEYEDEDDDVILKEETIEQIILDDDDDDRIDEEITELDDPSSNHVPPAKEPEPVEVIDDGFMDVNEGLLMLQNGAPIKVKNEPIDEDISPDDSIFETLLPEEADTSREIQEEAKEAEIEQPIATFVPSIDGNMEIDANTPVVVTSVSGKIKINIHKPLPVIPAKDSNKDIFTDSDTLPETVIDPSQPLPPGEEPIFLKLKPALQGIELKKLPSVQKGSELTGMCSVM